MPIVLDKIKVKCVSCIQYMPGQAQVKAQIWRKPLWEHSVPQTKNIPTDHNSVGVRLSFLNASLHQNMNCGHSGGEVTFPAASESCAGAWGQEWDGQRWKHNSCPRVCDQGL